MSVDGESRLVEAGRHRRFSYVVPLPGSEGSSIFASLSPPQRRSRRRCLGRAPRTLRSSRDSWTSPLPRPPRPDTHRPDYSCPFRPLCLLPYPLRSTLPRHTSYAPLGVVGRDGRGRSLPALGFTTVCAWTHLLEHREVQGLRQLLGGRLERPHLHGLWSLFESYRRVGAPRCRRSRERGRGSRRFHSVVPRCPYYFLRL